ncbi:amylo-alpha-1,6-glucosidase [Virgisporangium aurantiacum]|uniref:Aminotransferase n=1 Tax=Virgisporangium aurantiacum TaxID=175570 RepID=A0A8J3Z1L2_9ACTN|nr:glycogen debranching N-terminal domain-containing protein [Virgisporangium aurantiacum]GIJ54682.1 aminotransferase [Virgisporangium aurantiacum]
MSVLDGTTFVVSDGRGDVTPDREDPTGLFHRDTRHLSRWEVRLDGHPLDALHGAATTVDEAVFTLVEPTGTIYRDPTLALTRRRTVGAGMREELRLANHGDAARTIELSVLFEADFADLFEVKDRLNKAGEAWSEVARDAVKLGYRRADFRRETVIRAPGAVLTAGSLVFRVRLEPAAEWSVEIRVEVGPPVRAAAPIMGTEEWLAALPRLETGWDDLDRVYRTSLADLAALRFVPDLPPDLEGAVPAAGLPWFMALFGRDSLITSYQALPFAPDLCRATLRALAALQADAVDDFRDAEPGKIPHELRHGELVHVGERPHAPYYGSADATPLFLIVLDEYERWTGDASTVRDLEGAARAALAWLDTGFITYETRNPVSGLPVQCWKDSADAIVHPDGRLAPLPHATCELQGYAYDALVRSARLFRCVWGDPGFALGLENRARALRDRFEAAFWLPDLGFYALAVDGDGVPVRTLTSNIGHLLWSGIVPDDHVDRIVDHLLGPALFSGWGVRTLAAGQRPYNPMGYHRGTVWPHDTALAVAGLTRYGRRAEAATLSVALLEAAAHSGFRLPEVYVGTSRSLNATPVVYPTACSPQAWAAGTPLLLLRCLLGLRASDGRLVVDPHVPDRFGGLALRGIPGRWGRADAVEIR